MYSKHGSGIEFPISCYMGGKGGKEVMFGIGKGGVVTAFFLVDCLICVIPDLFLFLMNG